MYGKRREIAEKIIAENQNLVEELLNCGYVFYDQFKVTNTGARDIVSVLRKSYDSDEYAIDCYEIDVKTEGYCGIIYVRKKDEENFTMEELKEITNNHYTY